MRDDESDWFERTFIERRGPETWRAIGTCLVVACLALGALLIGPGTGRSLWEVVAGIVLVVFGFQTLSGISRMAWLAMGGPERPIRAYLRRRLGR